jgi:hypothetical protein
MNQTKRQKEMKDFVVQYFIRVCKNHKIYGTFRASFNKVKSNRSNNPFGKFTNIYDFKNCLENFTEKEYQNHRRTNDKYEKVTMMINHMMHFFLEKGGVDPRRLGMIGQEIFDLACYGIYGDEFIEDMEKMQQQQQMQNQEQPSNEMEAYLMQMYLNLYNQGKIDMDWLTFKKKYMPQLKSSFQQEPMIENKTSEYNENYYDFNEDDEFEEEPF